MYRGRQRAVGAGNGMLYMLALHAATKFIQLPRKPPVTASLILANTLVFSRPGVLNELLPTVHEVCLNPHLVIKNWDAKRLLLSAFYHTDDAHLVYNMVSLLWKGVQLENDMGSAKFSGMVAILLGMSHGLVVLTAKLLASYDYFGPMYTECSVGFSAVLFALKTVLNWDSPNYSNVYGILLPSKYAAWAELVMIQLFVPGTSFLGHLCGIVAGLIYVNAAPLLRGSYSPLVRAGRKLLHGPLSLVFWPFNFLRRRRPGTIRGRGFARAESGGWCCRVCLYDSNNGLSRACEWCGCSRGEELLGDQPTNSSRPEQGVSRTTGSQPTVEELRRARLDRFNRPRT